MNYNKIVIVFIATISIFYLLSCELPPKDRKIYDSPYKDKKHLIPVNAAKAMVKKYNAVYFPNNINDKRLFSQQGTTTHLKYETFNISELDKITHIDSIVGVRTYFGINDSNQIVNILTGVGTKGQDLYITEKGVSYVIDNGMDCPTFCITDSLPSLEN